MGIILNMQTNTNTPQVQGGNNNQNAVIKGGYYIAPSGPAKPLVETTQTWGTAMPSLASGQQQTPQSQPTQNQQQNPAPGPASQE